eukprot:2429240-Rhodomonas_salina.1
MAWYKRLPTFIRYPDEFLHGQRSLNTEPILVAMRMAGALRPPGLAPKPRYRTESSHKIDRKTEILPPGLQQGHMSSSYS